MFDIGFTELLLVAVIALVVLGPERLPQAIRTTAYWVGKVRRSFQSVKEELEREIDAAGIRQQLHNEAVMKELNKTREQFQGQISDLKKSVSIDPAEDQTASGVNNTSPKRDGGAASGDDTSAHLSREKGGQ